VCGGVECGMNTQLSCVPRLDSAAYVGVRGRGAGCMPSQHMQKLMNRTVQAVNRERQQDMESTEAV